MKQLLSVDVDNYCNFACIARVTAEQYRLSVRCFGEHLGRPAHRADLQEPVVNAWIASVRDRFSACTARNRKRGITPVWNWLASQSLVPHYNPRALSRIKVPAKPVQAWSVAQVEALLAGANDLQGRLAIGVPARVLMRAWVMVGYELGARPGDLLRLRREDFQGQGLTFTQNKTGVVHAAVLSQQTIEAVMELCSMHSRPTVFALNKHGMRRWELQLFAAAEAHGFTRRRGQSSGTLRKTHGTEVCRTSGSPTVAARSLGHISGDRVALQSYIEPDVARPPLPQTSLIDALSRPRRSRDHRRRAQPSGG